MRIPLQLLSSSNVTKSNAHLHPTMVFHWHSFDNEGFWSAPSSLRRVLHSSSPFLSSDSPLSEPWRWWRSTQRRKRGLSPRLVINGQTPKQNKKETIHVSEVLAESLCGVKIVSHDFTRFWNFVFGIVPWQIRWSLGTPKTPKKEWRCSSLHKIKRETFVERETKILPVSTQQPVCLCGPSAKNPLNSILKHNRVILTNSEFEGFGDTYSVLQQGTHCHSPSCSLFIFSFSLSSHLSSAQEGILNQSATF